MTNISHIANINTSPFFRRNTKDFVHATSETSQMANSSYIPDSESPDDANRNYLKAWLMKRKRSQTWLAEQLGTSNSVVSDLINGNRALTPKWLRRIAPLLETTPGFLLDHDPETLDTKYLEVWEDVDPDMRERAIKALEAFKKSA